MYGENFSDDKKLLVVETYAVTFVGSKQGKIL